MAVHAVCASSGTQNTPVRLTESLWPIRLLAFMESVGVTGPGKNVIDLCVHSREQNRREPDQPFLETCVTTFERGRSQLAQSEPVSTPFRRALDAAGIETEI